MAAPIQIVPYRGSAPALQDIMAGNIDLMFDQAASSLPLIRGGKIRAYAVTAKTRLEAQPDIPTVDEAGLPGFYMAVWHGIWVPAGAPKPAVSKLNDALGGTLAHASVRQRPGDLGPEDP